MGNGHLNNKSDICVFTCGVWKGEELPGPAPLPLHHPGKPRVGTGHEQKSEPLVWGVGMANFRPCWGGRGPGNTRRVPTGSGPGLSALTGLWTLQQVP